MDQNFEKLEELIRDEDKIVTMPYFALNTNISIEESKSIIEKYLQVNKGCIEIKSTYILTGRRKDDRGISVSLVEENHLADAKKSYEKESKESIFSLQRAQNVDYNVIALVDPTSEEVNNKPILGAITGKNCVKRKLKAKLLPVIPPTTIKGKSILFTKQKSEVKSEPSVTKKEGDANQNKNKINLSQSTVANLFSKAAQNKKPEQKAVKSVEKHQSLNGNSSKTSKHNSIKDLFNKENSNELENKIENDKLSVKNANVKTEDVQEKSVKTQQSDLFDSDTDDDILKDLEIKEKKSVVEKLVKKNEDTNKLDKSKINRKKKQAKTGDSKRRRIIVESDSDSDIFGSDTSEKDVIDKCDEETEPVICNDKTLPPQNKYRRRKAVDRTYQDEDGFIVTQTEYVYETASEDDNEPESKITKTEEKPKIEKKNSSNSENGSPTKKVKGKKGTNKKGSSASQKTITSFFKAK